MKTRMLGKSGLKVSALGFGCMGLSEFYGAANREDSKKVLQKAFEYGITFFDTADVYGRGENEKLLGETIAPFRNQIIIATKCGIQRIGDEFKVNNTASYIKDACNASLSRLNVSTIDLYYIHRHNPETPIEDAMHTMSELIQAGKIRFVGLSEVDAETLKRAHDVLGDKLVALQSEYSIINHVQAEKVLPTVKKLGVSFVAYSPIARGMLTGKITDATPFQQSKDYDFRKDLPQFQPEALQNNLRLIKALTDFAESKNCTTAQLCLAWLLAQGNEVIPIPGTKKLHYLKENIEAVNVTLTHRDLESLARIMTENPISGKRYPDRLFQTFHMKS